MLQAPRDADAGLPVAVVEALLVAATADDTLFSGKKRLTKPMIGIVVAGTNAVAEDAHGAEVAAVDARDGKSAVTRDLLHVGAVREVKVFCPHTGLDMADVLLDAGRQQAGEGLWGDFFVLLDDGGVARPLVALLELQRSLPKTKCKQR